MEIEFNWIAHVVAALSTLVVGFLWYAPFSFQNAWMKSSGVTQEQMEGANMGIIFGLAVVFAFLITIPLGFVMLTHTLECSPAYDPTSFSFAHGAFHGAIMGLFVALPVLATNALFERKNWTYILINAGYWVVCISIMGGIIFAWR